MTEARFASLSLNELDLFYCISALTQLSANISAQGFGPPPPVSLIYLFYDCLALFTPPVERAPVLPLAFANPIIANLTQPLRLDSVYAVLESPILVALAPLLVCQAIAEPTQEPRHTLAGDVHRARKINLTHTPPAKWTGKPSAPSAKSARCEGQDNLLFVLVPVPCESNHHGGQSAGLAFKRTLLPFKRIMLIAVCPHLSELKVTPRTQRMARLYRQARPPVPYAASTHFIVSLFPCMS